LGDQEKWPEGGSINYNTILQLNLFCRKEGKWTEIPYVKLFFYLRDHPEWLREYKLDIQSMAALCKIPPDLSQQQGLEAPLLPQGP
jgi:hypothetical protein